MKRLLSKENLKRMQRIVSVAAVILSVLQFLDKHGLLYDGENA